MHALEQAVNNAIEGAGIRLGPGERIEVSTRERCVCCAGQECKECGGVGWLFGAVKFPPRGPHR